MTTPLWQFFHQAVLVLHQRIPWCRWYHIYKWTWLLKNAIIKRKKTYVVTVTCSGISLQRRACRTAECGLPRTTCKWRRRRANDARRSGGSRGSDIHLTRQYDSEFKVVSSGYFFEEEGRTELLQCAVICLCFVMLCYAPPLHHLPPRIYVIA